MRGCEASFSVSANKKAITFFGESLCNVRLSTVDYFLSEMDRFVLQLFFIIIAAERCSSDDQLVEARPESAFRDDFESQEVLVLNFL